MHFIVLVVMPYIHCLKLVAMAKALSSLLGVSIVSSQRLEKAILAAIDTCSNSCSNKENKRSKRPSKVMFVPANSPN